MNTTGEYRLPPEERQFFNENGYVVIRKLVEQSALDSYSQRFQEICDGVTPAAHPMIITKEPKLMRQMLEPKDYVNKLHGILNDDIFFSYAEHPGILSVVSQLIGDDLTALTGALVNKPPGSSRHPAHQDLFYFPLRPAEKIIGSWTAVDPVNYENGCLFVVPGSHKRRELYPHGQREDTLKLYHGVDEETLAPSEKQVHLDMNPGDTVFFSTLLLHGSGTNRSKTYRKAITFHFANNCCHYIDLKNTVQEFLIKEIESMPLSRGTRDDYVEYFRMRIRKLRGVRSNL